MKNLKIPYENLALANAPFHGEISKAVESVITKGWYILGLEVESFEKEFAAYLGVSHCVGLNSGLDALIIALRVCDLPKGSEVIVPSNTYIATILSILQEGYVPVLVEPDLKTYNIDPRKIATAITEKTKAIMVVHLYGKACEMDAIERTAKEHRLALIEDCAQSHGAKYRGRLTGTYGLGAFSFYPTKNLGAMGDSGALTSNDAVVNERIRMIRNYGSKIKYYNEVVGLNSRLDELQAAILRVKLRALDELNERKRSLAQIYFHELANISDLVLPHVSEDTFDVFHIFNVRSERRDPLKAYLLKKGIGSEIHYPVPPHRQKALQPWLADTSFPISEEIHRTTLSLPISFGHTQDDVAEVARCIVDFFKTE